MATPNLPTAPDPTDLRAVFMPLSLVLLLVGMADGATILYSAWSGAAYTSNFYVFALIGAIFLGRGNLFTARIAMVAAAFFISAVVGMAAIVPLYMPMDLLLVNLKVAPGAIVVGLGRTALILALLVWAMKRLMHPVVLQALASEGVKPQDYWKRPALGFMLGFIVPFVNGVQFAAMQGSDLARQGRFRAAAYLKPGEKIYLSSVQPAQGSDSVGVIDLRGVAYTSTTVRGLAFTWPDAAGGSDHAAAPSDVTSHP